MRKYKNKSEKWNVKIIRSSISKVNFLLLSLLFTILIQIDYLFIILNYNLQTLTILYHNNHNFQNYDFRNLITITTLATQLKTMILYNFNWTAITCSKMNKQVESIWDKSIKLHYK